MKKTANLVIFITTFLFTNPLFAFFCIDDVGFNGGVDVGATKQGFETSFGDDHFADHYPYTNLYLGAKLNEYLGLEGGYEHIYRQDKKAFYPVLNGETVPVLGFSNPLNTFPVLYLSESFSKGWHFNIVGFWPICPNKTDLTASIGIAWMKMYFDTVAITNPEVATPVVRFANTESLARIALGIRQMITPHFGARLQLLWENTSKLDASTPVPFPLGAIGGPIGPQDNYTVKPKNNFVVNVGFFFEFSGFNFYS